MNKAFFIFFLITTLFLTSHAQLVPGKKENGEHFYPAVQNGRYGFINRTGDMVIPAVFQWCDYFHEGFAVAQQNGKYGFINPKGEWKIKAVYDSLKNFSQGMAVAAMMGNDSILSWAFVDTLGRVLETGLPALCRITNFSENRAVILVCGAMEFEFQVINRNGKNVFPLKNFYLDESRLPRFNEGYMRVTLPDNSKSYIDTSGHLWNKGTFQDVGDFSEGLAWFMENGKYGFINREGKVVIPAEFEAVSDFSEGLAKVTERQKYDPNLFKMTGGISGYINTKGKYIVSPQYEDAGDFHDGFALVKSGGFFGFINKEGSAVIDFQYADAKSFFRGFAFVKNEKHWQYINTSGKKVW